MDIFKILDEFEELVKNSKRVPITGKVMVSEDVILDFLDQIRSVLPDEIHQAKLLNKERERVIQEAREEAERIIAEAHQQANRMINESDLVRQAQAASEEIITQAKRLAKEIKSGATEYADEILRKLESSIDQNLSVIRKAREELNQMKIG